MEPDREIAQMPKFSDEQKLARIKKKPQIISLNDIYQEGGGNSCGYCHKEDGSLQWSFSSSLKIKQKKRWILILISC